MDAFEGFEQTHRGERAGDGFEPVLEADPQAVAEEGDEDVRFDSALDAMPDGPQGEFALQ